jgi:CheY-like chemotaxis protein
MPPDSEIEHRRQLEIALRRVLAEAATLDEPLPRILQAICESADWQVGALWSVTAVGSVTEAMAELDPMMPDRDGWDFRHAQKRDPKIADIPVIAVSAAGKLRDVDVSLRKPLDYDELLTAVRRYVSPSRQK